MPNVAPAGMVAWGERCVMLSMGLGVFDEATSGACGNEHLGPRHNKPASNECSCLKEIKRKHRLGSWPPQSTNNHPHQSLFYDPHNNKTLTHTPITCKKATPHKKSGRPQELEIAPHRNPDKKLQKKCSKIILESLQSFAHKTNTNAP